MLAELQKQAEIIKTSKPLFTDVEALRLDLENKTTLADFINWLSQGIYKTYPEAKSIVNVFDKNNYLVISTKIKDDMQKGTVYLNFIGIVSTYNLDTSTISVLGRFVNHNIYNEISLEPGQDEISWQIYSPKSETK